jgi:hypothetical protein
VLSIEIIFAFEGWGFGTGVDFGLRKIDRRRLGGIGWFMWNPFGMS